MPKFALASKGLYPLDTISDVVKAERYFLIHEKEIPLELRQEFCSNVAAEQNGYKLKSHEKIASYASKEVDPVKANATIKSRMFYVSQMPSEINTDCLEKVASSSFDEAVKTLSEFDRSIGLDRFWDSQIVNPVLALTKIAEVDSPPGLIEFRGERATEDQLNRLAQNWERLNKIFKPEFIDAFKKNQVSSLDKLSEDEKLVIIRMARDLDAQNGYYH